MVRNRLQKDFPLHRIKGIPEVQLQEHMIREGLLQPHADLMYQALSTSLHTEPHLFRFQATRTLRLEPGNQQLPSQAPECFAHSNGADPSTFLAQCNKATRDVNRYTRNSIDRDIANRSYIDLNFLGIAIIDIGFGISIYRDQCLRNSIIVV